MSDAFTIRQATTADLGTIADNLVEGLATYRSWTPMAWNPPDRTEMLLGLLQRFPRDGSWAQVAFLGSEPAGHIMIRPDRDEAGEPRHHVALLTQLFVREQHWGSGLAQRLHAVGVAHMIEHQFTLGRLLVANGHRRAEAFYARQGWQCTGRLETSGELGLELAEYLLAL
ncbi:MAG TPA: GNAT family N-acetyltransferase [Solirubrobacteraceae bacterium]|nr:GNAT family N-acetyltransferase [Solirubrobacteraceae bacterium]